MLCPYFLLIFRKTEVFRKSLLVCQWIFTLLNSLEKPFNRWQILYKIADAHKGTLKGQLSFRFIFCNSDPIPTQSKRKRIHIQDNAFSENFNEKTHYLSEILFFQKNFEKKTEISICKYRHKREKTLVKC